MRVLLVFNNLNRGGAQVVGLDYLRVLKQRHQDIDIRVLTFSNGFREAIDQIRTMGFEVTSVPCTPYMGGPYVNSKTIARVLERFNDIDLVWIGDLSLNVSDIKQNLEKPILIHLHSYWYVCPRFYMTFGLEEQCDGCLIDMPWKTLLCKHISNLRLRVLAHSEVGGPSFSKPESAADRHTMDWIPKVLRQLWAADGLIGVSNALMSIYDKALRHSFRRSPPSIVLPNFTLMDNTVLPSPMNAGVGKLKVLYAGGSSWIKGPHVLINALSLLDPSERARVSVDVIGAKGSWVERLAVQRNLSDAVRFHPYLARKEFMTLLRDSVVVAVPSVWPEPFGLLALEAQRYGKPVLGSNIGGIPEVVIDGENGWLFKPNDPQALADTLRQALASIDQMPSMGSRAKALLGHRFDPEKTVDKLVRFFEWHVVNP